MSIGTILVCERFDCYFHCAHITTRSKGKVARKFFTHFVQGSGFARANNSYRAGNET